MRSRDWLWVTAAAIWCAAAIIAIARDEAFAAVLWLAAAVWCLSRVNDRRPL